MQLARPYTREDLDLIERYTLARGREELYTYRQLINPDHIFAGWWQKAVAKELQDFYKRWKAGLRPILILTAPPQHGKSKQVVDFMSWLAGKDPDTPMIYASYSDDLGLAANMMMQRTMDGEAYRKLFFKTTLAQKASTFGGERRNSAFLEFVGGKGSFRNTTVHGQITGKGLGIGVIDDPIKGREEAQSPTIRDKTWLWVTDDFFTRFADGAGLIILMTRWHLDDPVGRLLETEFIKNFKHIRILEYPALGRWNNKGVWVADDNGLPLFPEWKSLPYLLARKSILGISSWSSLYQQNPIVMGGDMFPVEQFQLLKVRPDNKQIKRSVRYWDKAGTKDGGAYTAGVLMHELFDKRFLVEHVVRGQWGALEREKRIKLQAKLDNRERPIETYVEQEPGSGGKESAESTILNLRGYRVYPDRVTSKKEVRAEPYAAQVQAGNVIVMEGPWTQGFIDEHEIFPNGQFKDQVDAAAAAFVKLTIRESRYDASLNWVRGTNGQDTGTSANQ